MINRSRIVTGLTLSMILMAGCSDNDMPANDSNLEQTSSLDTTVLDSKISELLTDSNIPGMSIALVSTTSGQPVFWSKGYGLANIESQTPVDENTSFWMGSVSKAVLGTLLQMAQEQGVVNLDADIRADIASGSGFTIDDPLNRTISLRSLATHSSGIMDSDAYECAYYVNNNDGSVISLIDNLGLDGDFDCSIQGRVGLRDYLAAYLDSDGLYYNDVDNFSSSPDFEYSNIGAGLAGHYLELQSGQTLHEYASSQLFAPLGMSNSGWTSQSLSSNQVATSYIVDDGDVIELPSYELATYPDGGLRSSAADIAKFLSLIMNNGAYDGTQLLQTASIDDLTTPSEIDDEYGFFFEIDDEIGHSGSDPGAESYMFFKPDEKVGIVLIANGDADDVDEEQFSEVIELLFASAETL